jgi:hypothetical protein
MQHRVVGTAPHRPTPRARLGVLVLALAVACGGPGGGDVTAAPPTLVNTGPENSGTPDVSGFYTRSEVDPAANCSTAMPAGGTVILGSFSESQPIKLYQNGTVITLAYVNTPQLPADTGRVDLTGKIILGIKGLGMKENLRGTRQFYVDLTGSATLTPSQSGAKYTGTGDYTWIFREGSPSAAAYSTCTRTVSFDFTKTG